MGAFSVVPLEGGGPVRDIYNQEVVGIETTDTLMEAAQRMARRRVGALVVFEDGQVKGIFSEADLVAAAAEGADLERAAVEDFMTPDAFTVTCDDTVAVAAARMRSCGVHHLPVVEAGDVVGMLSLGDILASTGALVKPQERG